MVIPYGTQDLSTRQVPREPEIVPQHCPKFYLYTQKGPTDPQLVVGSERDNMYGAASFDLRGPYANHATVVANLINAAGNACMIERVIPEDAGPEATLCLWLDVLPTQVDDYARNGDGSIMVDTLGNPTVLGKIDGYKVKWILTNRTASDINQFGQANIMPGTQTDPDTNTQSQKYPILELKASSIGSAGNNAGIRLWAPTLEDSTNMPVSMMANDRAYPYNISVIRRPDANTSPGVVTTVFGDQYLLVTMKEGVINPTTDAQLYLGDVFLNSYQNTTDPTYPPLYGDFGSLAIYNDNISTLLGMFHTAEIPYIDSFSDFTDSVNDIHLFNFVSGVSSQNVPYHSYQFVDATDSVILSRYSNIYASGSSDGTMNDALFAELVKNRVSKYTDPNDPVQDNAMNVESIIYDTGFPLATKQALCQFIGVRKDTFVVLSTFDVNGPELTMSEEYSVAVALRTRLQMYPDSDYFGTPTMRGMIIGGSGKLLNSQYTKRLPLSVEVAIKSAAYMGAGNGKWKNGYNFDGAPNSIITNMYDLSVKYLPSDVRNRNWSVGLCIPERYDRRSYFFPALKTVYTDDTSVLNSYFVAMAICELNKIAAKAWREFSGVEGLTNAQLADRVNAFVTAKVNGIFDNRYVVVPDAFFTDMDLLRGYSWTLPIKIYAPSLMTVMTTYVQAYRISDLNPTA